MLDIRSYLEDIRDTINTNSPAHLKMFVFRHLDDDPHLRPLLKLDRIGLKLYLRYLKKEILPVIEEDLNEWSDDPIH